MIESEIELNSCLIEFNMLNILIFVIKNDSDGSIDDGVSVRFYIFCCLACALPGGRCSRVFERQ